MFSNILKQLIGQLIKWPGVGSRVATRYALYLAHLDSEERKILVQTIESLDRLKSCSFCHYFFDSINKESLCPICRDQQRQNQILCVVEKETDLNAIEETGSYRGRYFIIGPAIIWFETENLKNRAKELVDRLKQQEIEEIILAINPTTEGMALIDYLKKTIHQHFPNIKTTTPRQGLPRGAELEYADPETLKNALKERSS